MSSKSRVATVSFSIAKIAKSASLSSTILVRKRLLIRFNVEKDLSHSALVTAIVRAILIEKELTV